MRTCTIAVLVASLYSGIATGQELRRSGFVGVQVGAVPDGNGVVVQTLVDGGSAGAAGLRAQDVITDVNHHFIAGVSDFVQLVKGFRAGDTAVVTITRDGNARTVPVPIRARPLETAVDVDVRYDAVAVDGTLRRTIVTAPKSVGRHAAVLYLNGIGCFSQESLDLSSHDAHLLYGLTRAGYVTMRVEKSGMGDSEGPPCESPAADFDTEVRAYAAGLRALKRAPFVDPDRVFLVGLSVGGVEAPLVAHEEPVRGIVVVNTVAKPFFEYLLDSRRRQMDLRHVPADEIDRRMAVDELCNHRLLIEKQTPTAVLEATPACAEHIEYPAPFTFMQQWAALNVAAAWKPIESRVLVLYGTSDYISTVADDPMLADMINRVHPSHATLKSVRDMDHYMGHSTSMEDSVSNPNTRRDFVPAVLEEVRAWLQVVK